MNSATKEIASSAKLKTNNFIINAQLATNYFALTIIVSVINVKIVTAKCVNPEFTHLIYVLLVLKITFRLNKLMIKCCLSILISSK